MATVDKRRGPRPLSEFYTRVARLARDFTTGKLRYGAYDVQRIVEALHGKSKADFSAGEFARHRRQVDNALQVLKRRGVLTHEFRVSIQQRHQIEPFNSLESFLGHVESVSEEIKQQQLKRKKPPARPRKPLTLNEFQAQVAAIAHRHKTLSGGRYDNAKIIEELLGMKREEIEDDKFRKLRVKVISALDKLKRMGVIEPSNVRLVPNFRKATGEEIKKHSRLIHHLLSRGHPYLRRDWRKYVTYDDAVIYGEDGLRKALEKFDPEKGRKFSTYAGGWIAGTISNEVKKHERQTKVEERAVRLDEQSLGKREHYEVVPAPETTDRQSSAFSRLFDLQKQGKLQPLESTVVALRLYGHRLREIGVHYRVTRERVRQIEKKAKTCIEQQSK